LYVLVGSSTRDIPFNARLSVEGSVTPHLTQRPNPSFKPGCTNVTNDRQTDRPLYIEMGSYKWDRLR